MTVVAPPAGMLDWSVGSYEHASELALPFAREIVAHAGIAPGERVVDLGCGTGNGALVAAELGAHTTGVDPAPRLLEIARADAAERGLDATFLAGHAAEMPVDDGAADVLLSISGVTFAPDPVAAAAEMARVTAPGGRIVLSTWTTDGVIAGTRCMLGGAVRRALGGVSRPGFPWYDENALSGLLEPHGFSVTVEHRTHQVSAPSLDEYFEAEFLQHPLGVRGRAVLEQSGDATHMLERAKAALFYANEDPRRFRITSPYALVTAQRTAAL